MLGVEGMRWTNMCMLLDAWQCNRLCQGSCIVTLQVYTWFLATYKASVAVGMSGYFLLVLDMFGVGLLLARYVEPGELQPGTSMCQGAACGRLHRQAMIAAGNPGSLLLP